MKDATIQTKKLSQICSAVIPSLQPCEPWLYAKTVASEIHFSREKDSPMGSNKVDIFFAIGRLCLPPVVDGAHFFTEGSQLLRRGDVNVHPFCLVLFDGVLHKSLQHFKLLVISFFSGFYHNGLDIGGQAVQNCG